VGSSFKIVNIDKRQYLDPTAFGEPATWRQILDGHHAIAVSFLVCDCRPLGDIPPPAGSWHGDRVVVVSDAAPPGEHGVDTATPEEPDRNLYAMASEQFKDVSLRALAMLLGWRGEVAEELARKVGENPYEGQVLLGRLGDILHSELGDEIDVSEDCGRRRLERALARHVGPDWQTRYSELCRLRHE
jgi:hypothetical protein